MVDVGIEIVDTQSVDLQQASASSKIAKRKTNSKSLHQGSITEADIGVAQWVSA